ncbi:uncharacterized protein RHOBADRAFT_40986 [Rhodotorula graminis WP1]|uniref:Uncharacterized protein n=1 Tax=Rhodotorula graminis (strain WP1) TaxID=578459 RepID=A0A194SDC0_RHOGW|nr:uncharacterized protein RHOBADRAFT_40986 [Rhodotorula graminis WP1]KPV78440.1 hypothetical protein RHOBADRAFT_40986 [Rhodotorula graminis WP1]
MTSLDPTHVPGLERDGNPRTGQAVYDSVSPLHSLSHHLAHQDRSSSSTSRRTPPRPRPTDKDDDSDSDDDCDSDDGVLDKVPIPPIPDLRFEQGVLASIRPFLHRADADAATDEGDATDEKKGKLRAAEMGAIASANLTAEGGPKGESPSDIFMAPLRVQWSQVSYVLVRDQVVFPLLQGILWGVAGFYLSSVWDWNKARLAAKSSGTARPSLLRSVGLGAR